MARTSIVIALDEMHSSAVLSLVTFFGDVAVGVSVRVTREASRDWHRRHPSRRGLAETERLRAGHRYYSWSYWARIWDIGRASSRTFRTSTSRRTVLLGIRVGLYLENSSRSQ